MIDGCNFHDNTTLNTTNGWGGAMLLWDGAPVQVTNSTFANYSRASPREGYHSGDRSIAVIARQTS